MRDKRPTFHCGPRFSTNESAVMAQLIGHVSYRMVGFTRDEIKALASAYRFDLDGQQQHSHARRGNAQPASAMRNLLRQCDMDGLRIMALLSRYLEPDEDPVRLVAQGLAALGFDCAVEGEGE